MGGLVPVPIPSAAAPDNKATNAALAAVESVVVEAAMSGGGLVTPVVVGESGRMDSRWIQTCPRRAAVNCFDRFHACRSTNGQVRTEIVI